MDFHLFIIGNPMSLAIAQRIISSKSLCRKNYLIITVRQSLENQGQNVFAVERFGMNLRSKPPKSFKRSVRQLLRFELFRSVSELSQGKQIHLYLTQTRNFSFNELVGHPLVNKFSIIEDGSASYLHIAGAISNSFKNYPQAVGQLLKFSRCLLHKVTDGFSSKYRHNSFTPRDAFEYHCLSPLCFPGILAQNKVIHNIFEVFNYIEPQNQNIFSTHDENLLFVVLDQSISDSEASIISYLSYIIDEGLVNKDHIILKLHPSTKLTSLRQINFHFENKITLLPAHISLESITIAKKARFVCVNSSIYIYLRIMGKSVFRISPEQMPNELRTLHQIKSQQQIEVLFSQFS